MKIPLKAYTKGRFKFTIRDGETLEVKRETEWMDNLILDAGLNRMGTGDIATYCQVGTSNTAPAVGQTALVSYVAGTSTIQASSSTAQATPPYYLSSFRTYRFGVGAAAGNLSEVGIGWALSGSLWSRALIVDGLGSPTTITVLPTEVLDVTYELQVVPNTADVAFNISIGGILRSCVLRPANITTPLASPVALYSPFRGMIDTQSNNTAYTGTIGAITAQPTGTAAQATSRAYLAYSNNSYKKVMRSTWDLNAANFNIQAVTFLTNLSLYQVSFSPPLAKDSTKTLVLDFELTWARL